MSKPKNAEAFSPINYAYDVLISDVDAVKMHHSDPNYKYKDRDTCLRSLNLLIHQFNLEYRRTKSPTGQLIRLTAQKLYDSVKKVYKDNAVGDFEQFWVDGAHNLDGKRLTDIQELSHFAQKTYNKTKYGSVPSIWSFKAVEEALENLRLSMSSDRHETPLPNEESIRSTTPHQHDEWVTSALEATIPTKRTFSDTENTNSQPMAKSYSAKDANVATNKPRKHRRTVSSGSEGIQSPGLSSAPEPRSQQYERTAFNESFDIGETTKIMERLATDICDFVKHLFQHFRLEQNIQMVFDPDVSQPRLRELYRTCWGEEWPTVGIENRKLLAASDAVQSLVSAYLYLHIFQPAESNWIELAKGMDGKGLSKCLKQAIKPALQREGQTLVSEMACILLNCDLEQFQHYHQLMILALPSCILSNEKTRQDVISIFVNGFCETLAPLIDQIGRLAKAWNPYEKYADWKDKLRAPIHQLIGRAFEIKLRTLPTHERNFRFIWCEHGQPVDRDIMSTKAACDPSVAVVVLTTLMPGISFQQSDRQVWEPLQPAEVLEKLNDGKNRKIQVPETISLDP